MKNDLETCTRCILDGTIPNIEFDKSGVCNYCKIHDKNDMRYPLGEEGKKKLKRIIKKIKNDGTDKKYDCVIGVSGGVDSTYALYMAIKLGLRPLAVHFDNHWNTALAVNNVKKSLDRNGTDLYTYVVDWEEFKNLQISFLKASVPDVELLTDKAIVAVLYKAAADNDVKYVISGGNFRTEGMIPRGWTYWDNRYFKSVNRTFGSTKIVTYPFLSLARQFYFKYFRKIKFINILNYINCNKKDVIQILEKELGWHNYGGKHYESIFTRWFQSYYLPVKFGIDKRKVHLSALINSGQTTRTDALEEIEKPTYPKDRIEEDSNYVMRNLGLTTSEFEQIINAPSKSFLDYSSNYPYKNLINNILKTVGINLQERP